MPSLKKDFSVEQALVFYLSKHSSFILETFSVIARLDSRFFKYLKDLQKNKNSTSKRKAIAKIVYGSKIISIEPFNQWAMPIADHIVVHTERMMQCFSLKPKADCSLLDVITESMMKSDVRIVM